MIGRRSAILAFCISSALAVALSFGPASCYYYLIGERAIAALESEDSSSVYFLTYLQLARISFVFYVIAMIMFFYIYFNMMVLFLTSVVGTRHNYNKFLRSAAGVFYFLAWKELRQSIDNLPAGP